MCYSRKIQEEYHTDVTHVIGHVEFGGSYGFHNHPSLTLKLLLNQLFTKEYDRRNAEPVALMDQSDIPMLLIQSSIKK